MPFWVVHLNFENWVIMGLSICFHVQFPVHFWQLMPISLETEIEPVSQRLLHKEAGVQVLPHTSPVCLPLTDTCTSCGHKECGQRGDNVTQHPVCNVALTSRTCPGREASWFKVSISKNVAFYKPSQQSNPQHPHNLCTVLYCGADKTKKISNSKSYFHFFCDKN